jgi:hypothetical protein
MHTTDDPYEYVTAWIGTTDWTPEMVAEYLQACAYWQGRADERALADAELTRTLTVVFGGESARTPREAMTRHIRALDAQAARRRADAAPLPAFEPVDWPDAVVRLPGESDEHYAWRCRRAQQASA